MRIMDFVVVLGDKEGGVLAEYLEAGVWTVNYSCCIFVCCM